MGKDHLTTGQEYWATRRMPMRPPIVRPNIPRVTREQARPQYRSAQRLSFALFRALSPLLVPLMLGSACFVIVALLSISAPEAVQPTIHPETLFPLFFVFAAVGVILAAALAYAPNDTIWSLAMLAGLVAYGTITVWIVFGPLSGIMLIVGVTALVGVFVRAQMQTVLENSVHVMVLFGKYRRTLRPGFNLRLPGEQVWSIVQTAETTIEATARDMTLGDEQRIDAQAIVSCHVNPDRAYLTAPFGEEWPDKVRKSLELSLRETLAEMTSGEIFLNEASVVDPLNNDPLSLRLRGHLQQLVGPWGVVVEWVRPHSLRQHQPGEMPVVAATPAFAPLDTPVTQPDVLSGSHPAARPKSTGKMTARRPRQIGSITVQSDPAGKPDVVMTRGLTSGSVLPLPPAMRTGTPSPEALADAYTAVRERRITDPTTITRIALAFETLALDPVLGPNLPYNAKEAAQNLRQLAEQLQNV